MANGLMENIYNPDVLSCIANLSSDEVFTPPEVANAMLDMLPKEVFESKETKFLDPACKSGVFLREIAKRLIRAQFPDYEVKTSEINEKKNTGKELSSEEKKYIEDLQLEIDHVFKNQLYGIAITELTSMLSRRSIYCSKYPNGDYSVTRFENAEGNIYFGESKHLFINKKCLDCGASEEEYGPEKRKGLESHAYQFIHTRFMPGVFENMKFDVIIGNPPYQLGDSGAFASASPIYQKFVMQAKKLNPRYLSMIIPSRWFAGGKGLDDFRKEMLNDDRLLELHDFQIGADCFPGTRIAGGVCYFLWDREKHDDCKVYSHKDGKIQSVLKRPLLEKNAETFIRLNEAIPILRKVQMKNEESFSKLVSPRKPFGLPSDFFTSPSKYGLPELSDKPIKNGICIVGTYKYKTEKRYVNSDYPFPQGKDKLGKWKVFVSQVLDNGFDWTKEHLKPFLGEPNMACTETFLCVGLYDTKEEAENVISYMNTKFFHLLMFLKKVSHHVVAKVYEFDPIQDFSKSWTDEELFDKYELSPEEREFIKTNICDE